MAGTYIAETLKTKVRQRALELCEYCHTNERWQYVLFTIDHVIPISLGGKTNFDNLALACFHCNRKKSNTIREHDPETNRLIRLFNPRLEAWNDHFIWSADGIDIVPLSSTGRVTAARLDLNRERIRQIRAADVLIGRHPPDSDLIQSNP